METKVETIPTLQGYLSPYEHRKLFDPIGPSDWHSVSRAPDRHPFQSSYLRSFHLEIPGTCWLICLKRAVVTSKDREWMLARTSLIS